MVTPYMPSSPDGHLIEVLDGDAEEVATRGTQISDLGNTMSDAWRLISRLVEDGADMEGAAIDKVREIADGVSDDLDKASALYLAVGPHISRYAEDLRGAQDAITPLVTRLDRLWGEYYQLTRDADTAQGAVPWRQPDDDAEQSERDSYDDAVEHAQQMSNQADGKKAEWDTAAAAYDDEWDSWHTAFTTAAQNIKDGVTGKIEDSWRDDMKGLLDFLADVLAVAGIVLAVLAIVIGGPIIGALAAIVAIATLVVQLSKFALGDGDWLGLTFAIIGIVPFIGPAAKFLRSGNIMTQLSDDFVRLSGQGAGSIKNWMTGLNALKGSGFWGGVGKFTTEFMSGKSGDEWMTMGSRGVDALDTMATVWSTQLGIVGMITDSAQGAWGGAFDPDQNPFQIDADAAVMAPGAPQSSPVMA